LFGLFTRLCSFLLFTNYICALSWLANMSHSPSASISNSSETASKKRKSNAPPLMPASNPLEGPAQQQQPQSHIPKRGARACTSCRKGKNRCEGEVRVFFSRRSQRSVPLTEARLPRPRPGSAHHRLPVVAAKRVASLASSKNQRRRMSRPCLGQVSSQFCSLSPILYHF